MGVSPFGHPGTERDGPGCSKLHRRIRQRARPAIPNQRRPNRAVEWRHRDGHRVGVATADDPRERDYDILGSTNRRVTITRGSGAEGFFRYFEVEANGELELNGLKVTNAANIGHRGGAIDNLPSATLSVVNCYFFNNVADSGGAIANQGNLTVSGWGPTAAKSEFDHNTASAFGGAIYIGGNGVVLAHTDLFDTIFTDNVCGVISPRQATNKGGAIASNANGLLYVDGCTFTHNRAKQGGAIYADGGNTANPSVNIINSRFEDNQAGEPGVNPAGSQGGALWIHGLNVYCFQADFFQNGSRFQAGAIFQFHGKLTLDTCLFVGNLANDQGVLSHDVGEIPPPGVPTVVFLINSVPRVVRL